MHLVCMWEEDPCDCELFLALVVCIAKLAGGVRPIRRCARLPRLYGRWRGPPCEVWGRRNDLQEF